MLTPGDALIIGGMVIVGFILLAIVVDWRDRP